MAASFSPAFPSRTAHNPIDLRTPEIMDLRTPDPEVQVIDLSDDETDHAAEKQPKRSETTPQLVLSKLAEVKSFVQIQPLSAFWQDIIFQKMYQTIRGKSQKSVPRTLPRPGADIVVSFTDINLMDVVFLTVRDFERLLVYNDSPGLLNDDIITAVLQLINRKIKIEAARLGQDSLRHIFLPTQAVTWLVQLSSNMYHPTARRSLANCLLKHGIRRENIREVGNIYFPTWVGTANNAGHWILGNWRPEGNRLCWYDSAIPRSSDPSIGGFRDTEKLALAGLQVFLSGVADEEAGIVGNDWLTAGHYSTPTRDALIQCPQQKDHTDCGIYVLTVSLCRATRGNFAGFITGSGKDNLLRPYFAGVLLQEGWGGEFPWGGLIGPTILPPDLYNQIVVPGTPEYNSKLK